jgi:hyperosmotically inducible periplasmic protein
MNPSKSSLKVLALAALFSSGLGLIVLQTGCAATPTKESTGEYVDDSTITAKVKAAFIHDDTVKAFDVSVVTFKGVVQLSGFVDTHDQKTRAGELAAKVTGVRDVENRITVK